MKPTGIDHVEKGEIEVVQIKQIMANQRNDTISARLKCK